MASNPNSNVPNASGSTQGNESDENQRALADLVQHMETLGSDTMAMDHLISVLGDIPIIDPDNVGSGAQSADLTPEDLLTRYLDQIQELRLDSRPNGFRFKSGGSKTLTVVSDWSNWEKVSTSFLANTLRGAVLSYQVDYGLDRDENISRLVYVGNLFNEVVVFDVKSLTKDEAEFALPQKLQTLIEGGYVLVISPRIHDHLNGFANPPVNCVVDSRVLFREGLMKCDFESGVFKDFHLDVRFYDNGIQSMFVHDSINAYMEPCTPDLFSKIFRVKEPKGFFAPKCRNPRALLDWQTPLLEQQRAYLFN